MTTWIALSRSGHAQQGFRPREGYRHAAERMAVPVVLAELHKVVPQYALGFLPEGDGLMPVALLGVEQGRNLYVHADGRWLSRYVPALCRSHPFVLAATDQGEQALCVADDHLLEQGGEPLFVEGELSPHVAGVLNFLNQCKQSRQATRAAAHRLQEAGVLVPWRPSVPIGDGETRIGGCYRVDEQTLNALDAEALAGLQGDPLRLAYAQLFSMAQLEQLTERAALHARLDDMQAPDDLGEFFADEDDELRFDFDS